MAGREAMIAKCESFLGTVGRPNEATRWYASRNGSYFANAAWCNMFITWAAYQSGNYDAVCFGKDYAYTVWHAQKFQEQGRWHTDVAGIQRGDIVFFDWNGSNTVTAIDHVGIVTDVNGRDILTIEGNTSDRCARRVRHADTIAGYGRPAYAEEPGTSMYKVKAGDTLSKIGDKLGVDWKDIAAVNGLRSPYTIFPGQELGIPGAGTYTVVAGDTLSGIGTKLNLDWEKIAELNGIKSPYVINPGDVLRLPTGSGPAPVPPPPPPPPPPVDDEPEHDYTRVTYTGKTINKRTKIMLDRAQKLLTEYEWSPYLTQGSYNKGVAASAGTHDGGGVIDIRTSTMTTNGADICVQALRKAGFAAWRRGDGDGMAPHIHAVAIGDREMSSAAKSQIQQWREDTNGLANHGKDPYPDPYPAWTAKYR